MIEIKKCNYITGDLTSVSFGVSKIIKFLELDGRNAILLTRPKLKSGQTIRYLMSNKLEYQKFEDFEELISNKSNLFRIDLIVADFWHLGVTDIQRYQKLLNNLNIDYIILAKKYHYKGSDDITDYHIKRESTVDIKQMLSRDTYTITNQIDGWTSDIESLTKSYIRDKKINGIIGD